MKPLIQISLSDTLRLAGKVFQGELKFSRWLCQSIFLGYFCGEVSCSQSFLKPVGLPHSIYELKALLKKDLRLGPVVDWLGEGQQVLGFFNPFFHYNFQILCKKSMGSSSVRLHEYSWVRKVVCKLDISAVSFSHALLPQTAFSSGKVEVTRGDKVK
ncbi:MAG: hypothetical protein KJ804_11860 [Proteobacteria bacterium]|nr:hypothetical protein [Pseudomonadota bacterium]MBU1058998.1 hypothetical protein [Pseudomonadota bacterium]